MNQMSFPTLSNPSLLGADPFSQEAKRSIGPVDCFSSGGAKPPAFRSQSSSALGTIKPVPEFYEQYTSTVSDTQPSNVYDKLVDFLEGKDKCDFFSQPSSAQIQGNFSDKAELVEFTLRMYQASGPHNKSSKSGVLVECSRQSGCVMSFNSLFREIASLFEDAPVQGLRRRPPMFQPEFGFSSGPDIEFLQSVIAMAQCPYAASQREGLCTLSYMSEEVENQEYLAAAQDLLPILKASLESYDEKTRRAGAILLNNLSRHEKVQRVIQEHLKPIMVQCIETYQHSQDEDCFQSLIRNQTKQHLTSSFQNLKTVF